MKLILTILGGLAMVMGAVWFLQGINVLPGSFMTGDRQWAVNGAVLFLVGAALLALSRRRRRT